MAGAKLPSLVKRSAGAFGNLLISLVLSAVVLAISLLCSKGIEILSDALWPDGDPPLDVPILVTAVGIVSAVGIVGFVVIDALVTWLRAWREGRSDS